MGKQGICQVCGRTPQELEEKFGVEPVLFEEDGIDKCQKCIDEYEAGMGDSSSDSERVVNQTSKPDSNWRDQVSV